MAISSGGGDSDEVLSEINITPMVDVMLVLLVVFIITAPLMTNAIKVNLPDTDVTVQIEEPKKPVVVSVDEQGRIYLDEDEYSLDVIESELASRKALDPEIRLNLNADETVPYGTVAKLMVLIEKAGIQRLSFITEKQT
ncbi:biopolymer transporter ExbD [Cellvibrio fibrivorans]|uniref:Biopolymer transport protein ExbD n=1 Tax=Cellvibrio fibrivorans TaxID=126350 RepID=A0ABU1UY04_9GAMM|nr:biopolymer transporter ExbD [Cellvibrio fibrivorans]MDR7090040.1 biopolymer transport protein ExbD [Cellvibrio fibrivorans]